MYYIDDQGTRIGTWADKVKPPEGYVFCETFARDFPKWNLFRSELVDYRAWKQIGFYDPNLHVYEDFDMRIRLTKRLPIVYCDEPQSEYRLHQAGLSKGRLSQHFDALDYIYKKNLPLLSDLSESQRDYVTRRFGEWMATVAVRGAAQFLSEWQAGQACRLLLAAMRYDPAMFARPSLARALAPRALRQRISPLRRMWAKIATKQG